MRGNVLIMAGGTGGHVFPALACAREFQARGYAVHWLGTPRGIENELVPQAGLPLHLIDVSGLRGKGKLSLLKAPFQLLRSLWQARRIVRQLQPVCVLGMGGYVTGPGGLAARLAGVPLVIHEQNATAGLTNRWLARGAARVLQAFPPVTRCVRSCSSRPRANRWPGASRTCWCWAAAWAPNR
jgi:UDP-N-acetylglucosamine--N-acetylmuramyl-(pentapeptide) pyrophosphoryl-undecaprenol N-acetylglucosamine transferase